jgi:Family of unknown function (DUF6118)
MNAAPQIDDEPETPDRVLAELDAMREQLSAIEAALPDYGPSFSALEQQTQQIKTAIDKIAASPSVALSAAERAAKSARAISEILAPSLAKLQKAVEGTDARQSELIRLTTALHIRSMHRPFPWMWPAVALVVGFWLYPIIAATVPGGSNLAVLATGHRDRWSAGSDLMSAGNPDSFATIVRASQVLAENNEAFSRCAAAAERAKARQTCTIQVGPVAEK